MPPPKKPEFEVERGGTRGGAENFQWDSLKTQSKREQQHYLGVSAKLGSSNLMKISKPTISKANAEEKKAAKALEEKAMRIALGLDKKLSTATAGRGPAERRVVKKEESKSFR
jgi:hypothetical protein